MPINDSQSIPLTQLDDELSLLDIFEFIIESWKTIVGFTALGIAGAGIYLWVVPKQFEASAQIKMAQIASINSSNTSSLGINIEEPQALIARMALPSSYSKETIALCGLAEQEHPELALVSKVKFSIPSGVSGTLNLTIRDVSQENAKACANAIFQFIKSSQGNFIVPFINEANIKLADAQERLERATNVISRADNSGAAVSATYLATRDEVRFLLDQIAQLQNIITSSDSRAARLTAPIYLKEAPVFPHKKNSLFVGLILGGFFGLAFAFARNRYRTIRAALKAKKLKS